MDETSLCNTKEAAERLGVSVRRVRQWLAAGRFPGASLSGKDWRIPHEAVRDFKRLTPGRPRLAGK